MTTPCGLRPASRRQVGMLFFLVASLTAASGIGLSASLHFPEVLLDHRSFASSLVNSHTTTVVLSLVGLLASAFLLTVLSHALAPLLPEDGRRSALFLGRAAGCCWGTSAMLGLILVPLWANELATGVSLLAGIAFMCAELGAPLLLAAWTVILVRRVPGAVAIGVPGGLGLLAICARSSVWALNPLLAGDEGL